MQTRTRCADQGSSAHLEFSDKDPSTAAFKDLMDRALDKPKEQPQEVGLSSHNVREAVLGASSRCGPIRTSASRLGDQRQREHGPVVRV